MIITNCMPPFINWEKLESLFQLCPVTCSLDMQDDISRAGWREWSNLQTLRDRSVGTSQGSQAMMWLKIQSYVFGNGEWNKWVTEYLHWWHAGSIIYWVSVVGNLYKILQWLHTGSKQSPRLQVSEEWWVLERDVIWWTVRGACLSKCGAVETTWPGI